MKIIGHCYVSIISSSIYTVTSFAVSKNRITVPHSTQFKAQKYLIRCDTKIPPKNKKRIENYDDTHPGPWCCQNKTKTFKQ